MPGRPAPPLQQPAIDRKPRVIDVDQGTEGTDLLAVQDLGIDSAQHHGVPTPGRRITRAIGMEQVQDPALADHRVVIQVLLQPFPQLQRPFIEMMILRHHVVGAHDRGVAPRIAHADQAALQHGDIGEAMLLGQIVGSGQPVAAAADDDHIIGSLGVRIAPRRRPTLIPRQSFLKKAKSRIPHDISVTKLLCDHTEAAARG